MKISDSPCLFSAFNILDKKSTRMIEASNSTKWIDQFLLFLQRYYTPILVHLGLLGNCLSMCVFFGTKLRYASSSIYLGALATSDSGYLIVVFVSWLTIVKIELFNQPGYCEFFTFLGHVFSFLSVWLVVAFTVERYIAVKWPLRRRSLCTVARARIVVIGLTASAIFLCSPVILFCKSNTVRNMTRCDLDKDWAFWANIYNISDTVITFAVPLTIIVIFNTLIARNIYKSDHIRRTMTIESTTSSDNQNPRDRIPQTKVTKMLLIVSSAFFCFNMPSCVFRLIGFLYDRQHLTWLFRAQQLSYQIYTTSFGINFVLYCVGGRNFRNAMIRMFVKHSDRRRNGTLLHMTNHGRSFSDSTRRYSSTKRPHFDEQPKDAQETQKLSTTPDEKPPINE